MTDDDDLDERRELLRQLFANREPPPPADVVPQTPPSVEERREHYLALDRNTDTWAEVTIPGEVITDVDGLPVAMTPVRTETVYRGGAAVTRAQLEAVGLTPDDVPNLIIVDPYKKKETDQ